jgi:enamine deaminase RidA (YjgF/YER057c/UK114 family)
MATPEFSVRISNPETVAPPRGYSHVAEVNGGRLIYTAGQVAFDRAGNLVGPGDLAAQTRQVFENLKAILESVGATFANVVKLNYYALDISQMPVIREIRNQYINTENPPVSTAVEVRRLFLPEVLIEIEAVAALPA